MSDSDSSSGSFDDDAFFNEGKNFQNVDAHKTIGQNDFDSSKRAMQLNKEKEHLAGQRNQLTNREFQLRVNEEALLRERSELEKEKQLIRDTQKETLEHIECLAEGLKALQASMVCATMKVNDVK